MAVGDRVRSPEALGYAAFEVTDETVVNGEKQVGMLVKIVGDDGSTSAPATSAKQDTGNTSVASIDTKMSTLLTQTDGIEGSVDGIEGLLGGTGSIKDNGPAWTVVRTYTESADMTTAAAISAAPTSGQKVVGDDILVSSDTAMNFKIQMETSTNVLAKVFIPANGTVPITLRDGIKGDAADKKLFGKASVAGNVAITVAQHSEA